MNRTSCLAWEFGVTAHAADLRIWMIRGASHAFIDTTHNIPNEGFVLSLRVFTLQFTIYFAFYVIFSAVAQRWMSPSCLFTPRRDPPTHTNAFHLNRPAVSVVSDNSTASSPHAHIFA